MFLAAGDQRAVNDFSGHFSSALDEMSAERLLLARLISRTSRGAPFNMINSCMRIRHSTHNNSYPVLFYIYISTGYTQQMEIYDAALPANFVLPGKPFFYNILLRKDFPVYCISSSDIFKCFHSCCLAAFAFSFRVASLPLSDALKKSILITISFRLINIDFLCEIYAIYFRRSCSNIFICNTFRKSNVCILFFL